jgi:hypothetical protein
MSPASLQTFIDTRLALTSSVIPNSNYVIIVSVWNRLKYFCVLFCTVIIRWTHTFDYPLLNYVRFRSINIIDNFPGSCPVRPHSDLVLSMVCTLFWKRWLIVSPGLLQIRYSTINSIKSPASGAGNYGEQSGECAKSRARRSAFLQSEPLEGGGVLT